MKIEAISGRATGLTIQHLIIQQWIYSLSLALCILTIPSGQLAAQTWEPAGPAPRARHSAVLDASGKAMVVFGGTFANANVGTYFKANDVWRLNANLTWTQLNPTGTPPVGRSEHSAVYDTVNNRMIIFGGSEGNSAPCANDVWVLTDADGKTGTPAWIQLAPSGTAPSPRGSIGAGYDPNTNSMIVYGGHNCFAVLPGEVWVLSNANGLGTPDWTQLSPAGGGPGGREIGGGVAYDSSNNRLIVFGGIDSTGTDHNDTWILSNANGQGGTPTWTQLSPSGTLPAVRDSNSTVYDQKNNRLIVFGGESNNQFLQDAWILTNANGLGGAPVWTQLGPFSLIAEPRWGHTAVYNSDNKKMTIFGGTTSDDSAISLATNDVWVLSHANGK